MMFKQKIYNYSLSKMNQFKLKMQKIKPFLNNKQIIKYRLTISMTLILKLKNKNPLQNRLVRNKKINNKRSNRRKFYLKRQKKIKKSKNKMLKKKQSLFKKKNYKLMISIIQILNNKRKKLINNLNNLMKILMNILMMYILK